MRQFNSLTALLILGLSITLGSVPLFFLHHAIVVPHQNYRKMYGSESADVIDASNGKLYGCVFLFLGLTFIYIYFRARRPGESRHHSR